MNCCQPRLWQTTVILKSYFTNKNNSWLSSWLMMFWQRAAVTNHYSIFKRYLKKLFSWNMFAIRLSRTAFFLSAMRHVVLKIRCKMSSVQGCFFQYFLNVGKITHSMAWTKYLTWIIEKPTFFSEKVFSNMALKKVMWLTI